MNLQDRLTRCPRCLRPMLLAYGEASYRNLALFEATPWSPADEPEPVEARTEAAIRRYREQLPYKLAICYVDLERGTWQLSMVKSNDKLRPGRPLWKPHNCLEENPAPKPQNLPAVRTRSARIGGPR